MQVTKGCWLDDYVDHCVQMCRLCEQMQDAPTVCIRSGGFHVSSLLLIPLSRENDEYTVFMFSTGWRRTGHCATTATQAYTILGRQIGVKRV